MKGWKVYHLEDDNSCPDCKFEYAQDEHMRLIWRKEECFRCTVKRVAEWRREKRKMLLLGFFIVGWFATNFYASGFDHGWW